MTNDTAPASIEADALRVALARLVEMIDAYTQSPVMAALQEHITMRQARAALASAAAPKAEPVPAGEREELREGASYESINLAAMVLSDCGHSSSYEPLLERVAGRIDRHVERLLTAQREDLTTRAQAAPAAVAEPVAWLHDDPQRYDVIHAEVKDLLVKSRDAAGHLHRPLDKSAHYTIPLYAAPAPAAHGDAEDAARLDWLEANAQIAIERLRRIGSEKRVYEVASNDDEIYGEGDTLRAAIDAARAAKEGDKP